MNRVDPNTVLNDWAHASQGALVDDPQYVRRAEADFDAERQLENQHWLNATMDDVERIIAASAQMELALPKMTRRALMRDRFAQYWADVVAPVAINPGEATLHERMKLVRQEARVGLFPNGKMLLQWDKKAGLPLYDPDDAREEAMRLSRRMVPRLMELLAQPGYRAYYLCATTPNAPQGQLAKAQRKLYRDFYRLIRACKRKDRPFPIEGAVAVMESPLGRFGDWHPHLNVIVVCSGWLDYRKLRERWHWNMEMRLLDGHQSSIERAFREIIKYSCRTVSEKSLDKLQSEDPDKGLHRIRGAACTAAEASPGRRGDALHPDALSAGEGAGSQPRAACAVGRDEREAPNSQTGQAPAMEEWGAVATLEFHRAHKGFRRSRSYRALFGIPKPPPADRSGVEWIGRLNRDARGYRCSLSLLESIPGDKSTTPDHRERLKAHLRKVLGDPDGHRQAIEIMQRAMQSWR